MANAKPTGLERDFGYLMPFFDKVAEAAGALPDPAARQELERLLAGQKERWERIRALLGGAQASAAGQTRDLGGPPPVQKAAEPERVLTRFTVGPLNRD